MQQTWARENAAKRRSVMGLLERECGGARPAHPVLASRAMHQLKSKIASRAKSRIAGVSNPGSFIRKF